MIRFLGSRDGKALIRDSGLALALALGSVAPVLATNNHHFGIWASTLSAVMCLAVAVRRVLPLAALFIVAGAGAGMALMLTTPMPALIAIPIVVYSVARHQDHSAGIFVAILAFTGSLVGPISWTQNLNSSYRFVFGMLLAALCLSVVASSYLLGRLLRQNHITEMLDREVTTQRFTAAQRQTEQASELATGRARAKVAQELHDVLAHSLSIIVVQAEGAKALTTKRPEAATQALDVIAETGRRSISEVRRIVAVMRGENDEPKFVPMPSLTDIPELVKGAGERVSLIVSGQQPLVPESLGLVAYRVVQESITNFLKHAGPTAVCEVSLNYGGRVIRLSICDDGIGTLSGSDGQGSGLPGMRERVLAMGGTFRSGPRAGGGYEVRAELPMPSQLGNSWLRGN